MITSVFIIMLGDVYSSQSGVQFTTSTMDPTGEKEEGPRTGAKV